MTDASAIPSQAGEALRRNDLATDPLKSVTDRLPV